MTQGKSLVEDMARAIAHESDYDLSYTLCKKYAEACAAVLKDRLPADDRELVERLQTVGNSGLTVRGQECAGDTMLRAADRIIAYSASRDEGT